jgi:hypothetical protein
VLSDSDWPKHRNLYKAQAIISLQRCRLLRNRALKWINLHEDQPGEQLNAVDPFLGGMAASSPSGGNEDPEAYAWQADALRSSCPVSLLEFRRRCDFTRERLKYLLSHTARLLQTPAAKGNNLRILATELSSAFSEFCALRGCLLAWQDVETGDTELMSRAANALLELGIREKASNAENDT